MALDTSTVSSQRHLDVPMPKHEKMTLSKTQVVMTFFQIMHADY